MDGVGAAGIALAVALLTGALALLGFLSLQTSSDSRKLRRRIGRVSDRWAGRTDEDASPRSLRRQPGGREMPLFEALGRRLLPKPELMRQRLASTGRNITLGNYAAICATVGIATTALRSIFLPLPMPVALLLGVVAGLGLPHLWVTAMVQRRLNQFNRNFPESLDLIVRGLKSGLPVSESIRVVGEEFDGPLGEEFRQVADRVRLGETLEQALKDTTKRINSAEFHFFIISLTVQRETGGNLAETLENLSDILRRRRQMKLKIKALSSEAKASAIIIGSLPFIMFVILYMVDAGYMSTLFIDKRGQYMAGAGLGLILLGIFTMWRMVRFEI